MKAPLSALALAFLLTGCSFSLPLSGPEKSVQYYVLSAPTPTPVSLKGQPVGIMPVSLPGYLARPQLVLREPDDVNILVYDFHRWGEELGRGVARVVCDTLTSEGLSAVPLRTGTQVDGKLMLDIRRLDGPLHGNVMLDALWTLQREKTVVRSGHVFLTRPAGDSMTSMVEAQSELVQALARNIAAALR